MTHQDMCSPVDRLAQLLYEFDPQGKGSADIRPWASIGYATQTRYLTLAQFIVDRERKLLTHLFDELAFGLSTGHQHPLLKKLKQEFLPETP